MISPLFLLKRTIHDYKHHWKKIFTISFVLALTATFALLLFFIQDNLDQINIIYSILYFLLGFNAIFVFINFINYLYKNEKQSYLKIFTYFKSKTAVYLILLAILIFTIFSFSFTFPLLIFPIIYNTVNSELLGIILIITTIILILIGIILITFMAFSAIIAITEPDKTLNEIVKRSYYIVRKSFFAILGQKALIVFVNLLITTSTYKLFIILSPQEWFISIQETGSAPISFTISYLLISLIIYTIVIFINLPYEMILYKTYKAKANKIH